jgi:2'-5' RNA ligase
MKKLAVDVVLLPPDEVMAHATAVNQKLNTQEIDFKAADMYPHLTLLMGCLEETWVPEAAALLQEVAEAVEPLSLRIKKITTKGSVSFEIKRTAPLQDLHEMLSLKLAPLLSYDATAAQFYAPGEVKENAITYVNRFRQEASHENFWPHITLGLGEHPAETIDLSFTADRLALCHLGKHCTCRQILREVQLRRPKT